jgi:hypothetical protein
LYQFQKSNLKSQISKENQLNVERKVMSGNSSPTIQSDAERAKSLKAKLTSLFPDSLPHIDRCLDSVRKNKKLSLKEPMGLIFLFFFFFSQIKIKSLVFFFSNANANVK